MSKSKKDKGLVKSYDIKGNGILVGDLHLDSYYQGKHIDYSSECYYNLMKIEQILTEGKSNFLILLGDIIGVNTTNIKDNRMFADIILFFNKYNALTKGHVYAVKGNHDAGSFTGFDFLCTLGLIKRCDHLDYYNGNNELDVRLHMVDYGDEERELDIYESESHDNVLLGHNDYYVDGVTNWYATNLHYEIANMPNLAEISHIISGHIHKPSDEIIYAKNINGNNIQLIYPGSPSRTFERYEDCHYVLFETDEDGDINFSLPYFGLQPVKEVFRPNDDFLEEDDMELEKIESKALKNLVEEVIEGRIVTNNIYEQIDKFTTVKPEIRRRAKKYLQEAENK